MNTPYVFPPPRAGAVLGAFIVLEDGRPTSFVCDQDTGDFWSICARSNEVMIPVQRHTADGWVAAVFHKGFRALRVAAPGERLYVSQGRAVVSRLHHRGVRWEFEAA